MRGLIAKLLILSIANADVKAEPAQAVKQEVSPQQMGDWLTKWGLLEQQLHPGKLERYYQDFSSIAIGHNCIKDVKRSFIRSLLPMEDNIAAIQYCIGLVDEPCFQYQLNVSKKTTIASKAMRLNPAEEKMVG